VVAPAHELLATEGLLNIYVSAKSAYVGFPSMSAPAVGDTAYRAAD
jgi:hypothetical protein